MKCGSLFAGIGGFDLGFEQAGFRTHWQVEINPIHRLVLAERFPHAQQFADIRDCCARNIEAVEIIAGGFPCQDISVMGNPKGGRKGLAGERSGLFWEAVRIVREVRPQWLVLENVAGLVFSNDGRDLQTIITALAECGYVGCWRVLNAVHFGVPQNRRRLFIVAGRGRQPAADFLADAAPVESIPVTLGTEHIARSAFSQPLNCLLASNTHSRIALGCEVLVAHEGGWDQMVDRMRSSEIHGIPCGLDDANHYQRYAAGNAVVPAIARWIAEIIKKS